MQVKGRDGQIYEVSAAPPGGAHQVHRGGVLVGHIVLLDDETRVEVKHPSASERLLVDLADRFVAQGGAPMGIA
jgi:hypothetical protein